MRRKEREVTDLNEIKAILARAEILRVALTNGDYPYLFPVNYGFEMDGAQLMLFFHGAKEGTKHAIIARNNKVTFEVDCGHALMQPIGEESCTSSFAYESVIGNGTIEEAAESEKETLLTRLLEHYGIAAKHFNPVHLANTVVYRIKVANYTAKRRVNDRVQMTPRRETPWRMGRHAGVAPPAPNARTQNRPRRSAHSISVDTTTDIL